MNLTGISSWEVRAGRMRARILPCLPIGTTLCHNLPTPQVTTERATRMSVKSRALLLVVLGSMVSIGSAQAAGDVAAGQAKAAMCAGCHGMKGEGIAPAPALAGKPEADQVKALQEFKSGARTNPLMAPMAAMLSDADMENVAAYYSSLK
jgi:cytochrome c